AAEWARFWGVAFGSVASRYSRSLPVPLSNGAGEIPCVTAGLSPAVQHLADIGDRGAAADIPLEIEGQNQVLHITPFPFAGFGPHTQTQTPPEKVLAHVTAETRGLGIELAVKRARRDKEKLPGQLSHVRTFRNEIPREIETYGMVWRGGENLDEP